MLAGPTGLPADAWSKLARHAGSARSSWHALSRAKIIDSIVTLRQRLLSRREFLERVLPSLKVHNPQLDVAAQVKRGQHPHLTADYGEP